MLQAADIIKKDDGKERDPSLRPTAAVKKGRPRVTFVDGKGGLIY